jgi:hypothetical protein
MMWNLCAVCTVLVSMQENTHVICPTLNCIWRSIDEHLQERVHQISTAAVFPIDSYNLLLKARQLHVTRIKY